MDPHLPNYTTLPNLNIGGFASSVFPLHGRTVPFNLALGAFGLFVHALYCTLWNHARCMWVYALVLHCYVTQLHPEFSPQSFLQ